MRKPILLSLIATAIFAIGLSGAWAQTGVDPTGEGKTPPSSGDHGHMDHGPAAPPPPQAPDEAGTMDHGSMQGGAPPPDARDPHAYSEGYGFGPMRPRMGDEDRFGMLLVDRLERAAARDNAATQYEVLAGYGGVYDRAVLKAEGEIDGGEFEHARTELLWGHAVAAYWDTQLGLRYDGGQEPSRTWLAFGIQGLAPYWFEVDATAYVGEHGRTAFRLEAEYELLLTQKLILQPRIEANVYGKRDAERELGSGLSDLAVGVRLRYEIRRELAPYIGVERSDQFGGTADLARAAGHDTQETRIVAGLRFWF